MLRIAPAADPARPLLAHGIPALQQRKCNRRDGFKPDTRVTANGAPRRARRREPSTRWGCSRAGPAPDTGLKPSVVMARVATSAGAKNETRGAGVPQSAGSDKVVPESAAMPSRGNTFATKPDLGT